MSQLLPRRPMDSDERIAVTELQGCRLTPASWDKRFIRHLGEMRDVGITEKEVPQLWRIFIRYRRQIGHPEKNRLLDKAAKLSAPDLRKQAAAQREQARIDELKRGLATAHANPIVWADIRRREEARNVLKLEVVP